MDKIKGNGEQFKKQFSKWEKCVADAKVKTLEELYKKVHAAVRANPIRVAKPKKEHKHTRDAKDPNVTTINGKKYRRDWKLNREQRRVRVAEKIQRYVKERSKAK